MDTISVALYVNGYVVAQQGTVEYSKPAVKMMMVPRSITYSDLMKRLYKKLNINSKEFMLKLTTKYAYMEMTHRIEFQLCIEDDDNLHFMTSQIDLQCLHLYIESESVQNNVCSNDLEAYIPCITQGFSTMGFDDGGGTSNVVVGEDEQPNNWDRYANNHVVEQTIPWADDGRRWESSARRRCNPYEITPFTSYDEQTRRDFFMDSYHDEDSDEDSPSNDSEDGNVDENDDNNAFERDVGYSQGPNEGTSSQAWRQGTVPDNIQADRSIICEDPPFFSQVYDEQIPDSTDLPYASITTYYNPERGDLCINMIFKDKKELIASVKDYSVRVARREYRVVQSSPTFWKVCCKNKSSTMPCHWGLRASLKVKSGYWKITKYGGSHTCISSHVGLDHHNMDMNMAANTLVV
ncbi:uncharacterized protein [Primulina eburnea]|uniref:uncharacterized protein n=1 Tax=Primulina eburnea TaxID=1245227 RepID=UPI003C6BFF38